MGYRVEPARDGLPETVLVLRWRRAQFVSLGFTPREASALMRASADVAEVRKLIEAGCPPETACRIVL
jgi:hypothetical protein